MEDLLRSKGLYWITLGKEITPTDADKKSKWDNSNDEVRGLIRMSISPDLRFHLQSIDKPKESWEKIESVFGKQNIIQAKQLENQVLTLSPSDFSSIEDYLSKFKTLRTLCEECKIKIDKDRCIYLILSKLGIAYYVFVSTFYAMQEALGEAYQKPSLENFCDSLIREQDKLVQLGVIITAGTSNKALVVHQKDKPKNPKKQHPRHNNKQYKGPKPTQTTFSPNGDKGGKYKNKNTNRHCKFCDKYGHDESKCFKKMETLEATIKKHNISIDSTSSSSCHGHALSASGFSFNINSTSTSTFDEWLIDSGASYHMAKDRAIFSTLNESNTNQIFVGDDRALSVEGSGTIQVENGHFNDVLCVPSLSCNLLLEYQITHSSEGKTVEFSPHQFVIKDLKYPKHVLETRIVDDITKLYKFDNFGSSSFSSVFVAHCNDLIKLWHERYLNYHSLQQLCNQYMVTGLPLFSCRDGVCAGCVLDKHHRDSFDKCASWHTLGPLQLVHGDLCGPLSSPSFSGCNYFLTFIYDFSRRTWVYFLKLKSEVFDKFLAYKALVEKKFGHQIQRLRTDNGEEYVNNNFTCYYTTQGIQMQHIGPYTPQQNGVVERKNRTLKEMANCMIQSKG
jgi:hypothetical protein